ncbi:putative MFS family arabinose efflux permease [Aneurinibacillus soli]|uniref:Purine efflux pump PbuE n=1 Tax=Aneurinibacillus soli TaxID=1500254 RepID=A0A0U5BBY2_9BACL|nr:MFS transporter [Aneurinibacillus soli]PYE61714.1 putative MFS family arabinose efflux permease [Aneurinibacillus soli]BAU28428.1 Purine efflux pump PbuE [Aneurinibacillus soli]
MEKNSPLFFIALGIFGIINTELGVVGILPMIMEKYNVTAALAGMLVSSFALIIALFGPWMTLLMSRLNRKTVLIGILLLFAVSNVISAFAPSFYVLMVFRMIPAFFHPVYFSIAFVLAAALSVKEEVANASAKVFLGVSMGMVLGIPLTSYIANQFSLSTSFLFSAIVNGIACVGIGVMVPFIPGKEKISFGRQLKILYKPALWLNIAVTCFILAAMFSVYSYFAEYLGQRFDMSGKLISVMLVIFGVCGVAGNWYAGRLLSYRMLRTVLLYPVALGICYLLLFYIKTSLLLLCGIIIVWGAIHTSGLIVSQIWLTSEAPEAPEFANSLFVSFSNLGVTIGTAIGGWFISRLGITEVVWSGLLFAILSFLCIVVKTIYFDLNIKSSEKAMVTEED